MGEEGLPAWKCCVWCSTILRGQPTRSRRGLESCKLYIEGRVLKFWDCRLPEFWEKVHRTTPDTLEMKHKQADIYYLKRTALLRISLGRWELSHGWGVGNRNTTPKRVK